jgi:hypothetical protein
VSATVNAAAIAASTANRCLHHHETRFTPPL